MSNSLLSNISLKKPINGFYNINLICKIQCFRKLSKILEKDLNDLEEPMNYRDWSSEDVEIDIEITSKNFGQFLPVVSGELRTQYHLACKNCLRPLKKVIRLPLTLILCRNSDTEKEINGYDLWELSGDEIKVHDLIEEILILDVPLYAKHDKEKNCITYNKPQVSKQRSIVTPFADLRNQLNKKK